MIGKLCGTNDVVLFLFLVVEVQYGNDNASSPTYLDISIKTFIPLTHSACFTCEISPKKKTFMIDKKPMI